MFEKLSFNEGTIKRALSYSAIPFKGTPNSKGWLSILCPNHSDRNFGSCSINVESGYIKCYSCGFKKSIISVLSSRMCISTKEAIEKLKNLGSGYFSSPTYYEIVEEIKPFTSSYMNKRLTGHILISSSIDPEDYYYTRKRGFTKEFCDTFKIERCFSDRYEDYFIVPIFDKQYSIYTFEFRKLMEYEYLLNFFEKTEGSLDRLKKSFSKFVEEEQLTLDNGILHKGEQIYFNKEIKYLLSSKVKYEPESKLKSTLFNRENLNKDEPLYLVEGIGSVPKIWSYISKNCTCTFGSTLTKHQLNFLKEFKEIIIIPDSDIAGEKMVRDVSAVNTNTNVIPIQYEDTDDEYVSAILNTNKITGAYYSCRVDRLAHNRGNNGFNT